MPHSSNAPTQASKSSQMPSCIGNRAVTATNAQRVKLMAVAVAVALWDVASTVVNRTRTIADAASIEGANTIVNVVADTIAVGIRSA